MSPRLLLTLGLCVLPGCASLGEQIAQHLDASRFEQARLLLEQKGVGAQLNPAATPEDLAARAQFTAAVEKTTGLESEALLARGAAHDARKLAKARLEVCPWSERVQAISRDCDAKLAEILAAEQTWTTLFQQPDLPIDECRRFLADLSLRPSWYVDSQTLQALRRLAQERLLKASLARVDAARGRLTTQERLALMLDLQQSQIAPKDLERLQGVLDILADLPIATGTTSSAHLTSAESAALRKAKIGIAAHSESLQVSPLSTTVYRCWRQVGDWVLTELTRMLRHPDVTYDELCEGERWVDHVWLGQDLEQPLALAHVTLASACARQGLAATVALVHIDRATALGMPKSDPALAEVRRIAEATRFATPRPTLRLRITCDPRIDPQEEQLVATALRISLSDSGGDNSLAGFTNLPTRGGEPTVEVHLHTVELVLDTSGVRPTSSSYLSHYQDVPNPRKDSLRFQVDMAESSANGSKRSYDSAVSSHNIYPTPYSLTNVNLAYNNYVRAVDEYNFLVSLFNSTPSTVSEPVFMPYTFRQGTVRYGWRVGARIEAQGEAINQTKESIATDFVRLGARSTDRTETQRRVDPVDIDLSVEAGWNHLHAVARDIREAMNPLLGKLVHEATANLAPEQQRIVAWLHHPLGIQAGLATELGVPGWAVSCTNADGLTKTQAKQTPPATNVARSPEFPLGPMTPETATQFLSPFVCETRSTGDGADSSGTGTLIGENGLILTCAHVLDGPQLEMLFHAGKWKGRYAAEVLFINAKRDVALLRAKGLTNDRWANVRTANCTNAGEAIIAIGNPGMDVGGVNLGGVSAGIVSNPMLPRQDTHFLSADISIASGSSGGPLFSLKDGELIGVVQLVATVPGLASGEATVSSTGFLCLAAPSSQLSDWLGLVLGN